MRRGRRNGVIGLLGLSIGLAGCAKGSEAGSADEPAGKVVSVAGSVTATRPDAEPRPLALNAPVFRDDTIATGADSSVTIVLAHNEARWDIAAGQSHRVERSLAWKAPKGAGGGGLDQAPQDRTAAAGRHTERESAQTAGTAVAPAEGRGDGAGTESAALKSEAPKAKSAAPAATSPAPKQKAKRNERRRAPPKRAKATKAELSISSGSQAGPPRTREVAKRPKGSAAPKPDAVRAPADAVTRAPAPGATRGTPESAASLIRKKLKTCHVLDGDEKAGKVSVTIKTDKSGKIIAIVVNAAAGLEKVASCVKRKLAGRIVTPPASSKASASMTFK